MPTKHDEHKPGGEPLEKTEPTLENEARNLQEQVVQTREQRIKLENDFLNSSVEQRKIMLLDYIRRGRLADGIEVMPQCIDAMPKLLEATDEHGQPLIDLTSENYNCKQVKEQVVAIFDEMQGDLRETDNKFRLALEQVGLTAKDNLYLDQNRIDAIKTVLERYQQSIEPANLAKIKAPDPIGIRRRSAAKQLESLGLLEISTDEAIEFFSDDHRINECINLSVAIADRQPHPIRQFVRDSVCTPVGKKANYKPDRHGFIRIPRLEDYDGEIVEPEAIDLDNVRMRPHLGVIKRGDVPSLTGETPRGTELNGATLIDGNVGYTSEGDIRDVEGLHIIDHHDQLEKRYEGKSSDTATSMVMRLLKEHLGAAGWGQGQENRDVQRKNWKDGIRSFVGRFGADGVSTESGAEVRRLKVYVNHLDTDAVLSAWAYRQPRQALKYDHIIGKVSTCGDFLLGTKVMEHGATARDYEYIIRNYLRECFRERLDKAKQPLQAELAQVDSQISELAAANELDEKNLSPSLKQAMQAAEAADPEIQRLNQEIRTAPGSEKRRIAGELQAAKQANETIQRLQEANNQIQQLEKQKKELQTTLDRTRITPEDNTRILNHMLDIIEDIISNPFKYQRFLMREREREEATIGMINREYREGVREIRSDAQDEEILIMEPTTADGKLSEPESIDGVYFALRQREDWNRRIIVTREQDSFMVAINTQNAKHLEEYDFNALVNTIRPMEEAAIRAKLAELEAQGDLSKAQKKELKDLQRDLQANQEGQLWRNRTQMIFCMRTHIPTEQFMQTIRNWKQQMETAKAA